MVQYITVVRLTDLVCIRLSCSVDHGSTVNRSFVCIRQSWFSTSRTVNRSCVSL